MSDRLAGGTLLAAGTLIAIEARGFEVRFLTDPIGPKGLPLVVALILIGSGVSLLARPASRTEWPSWTTWLRGGLAAATLAAYASVLGVLGFLLSTTLGMTALALVFKAPPLKAVVTALIYSSALYVLFGYVLGVQLPVGSVFLPGG